MPKRCQSWTYRLPPAARASAQEPFARPALLAAFEIVRDQSPPRPGRADIGDELQIEQARLRVQQGAHNRKRARIGTAVQANARP